VRKRKGYIEVTVDFCHLAGKLHVGVIRELVEDGIIRHNRCLKFGKAWGIKVCIIKDLVEYLKRIKGPILNRKY
jgi:3,4-dihydroxy-2-butanone 4-phosphate synthase